MVSPLSPTKTGLALAISMSILYVACFAFYAVIPQFAMGMQMMTFHEAGTMAVNTSPAAFVYGLVLVLGAGYATGALFAFFYRKLAGA